MGVVAEVDIELAMLSVVTVELCKDVVGLSSVANVTDEVEDTGSIEEVIMIVVELGISCDVSKDVGFACEVIVEPEGADSVAGVDGALSVAVWSVVGATMVELSTCRIELFIGKIQPARAFGPTDTRLATATKKIAHNTNRLIGN